MIKSVRLQNFFSFEDETIELHPEANIFVGINGSGKSNVLKAFKLLQEGMAGRLRQLILDKWGGFDAVRFKAAKKDDAITIILNWDGASILNSSVSDKVTISYQLDFHPIRSGANFYVAETMEIFDSSNEKKLLFDTKGEKPGFLRTELKNRERWDEIDLDDHPSQELYLPFIKSERTSSIPSRIRKKLLDMFSYDYFDTTSESSIRRPVIATSEKTLSLNGANLPQMINTIRINDKINYRNIVENLTKVNPNFTGIDFNVIGGNIELMLEETKFNSSVHVTHISDGTLRFLCLMAIFFNENRGRFICIDEPELGLHPDMIKAVFDAMMQSTDKTQYLITTHSDHLLDHFELESIRVVEKDDNNSSKVKALNAKDFEGWYDVYSPGNMWRSGDFGGNRY